MLFLEFECSDVISFWWNTAYSLKFCNTQVQPNQNLLVIYATFLPCSCYLIWWFAMTPWKICWQDRVAVAFSCDFVSSGSHSHSQGLTLRIHLYGWCLIFLLFLEHQWPGSFLSCRSILLWLRLFWFTFSQSRSYIAYTSLWVVSDLPLVLGAPVTWILRPHYTSSKLLPSSLNSYSHYDAQSRKGAITYSLLRQCGWKNEDVQKDAISIDGDRIRPTEGINLAWIQAKDTSTGRLEVSSCIRVAEDLRYKCVTFFMYFYYVAYGFNTNCRFLR